MVRVIENNWCLCFDKKKVIVFGTYSISDK